MTERLKTEEEHEQRKGRRTNGGKPRKENGLKVATLETKSNQKWLDLLYVGREHGTYVFVKKASGDTFGNVY